MERFKIVKLYDNEKLISVIEDTISFKKIKKESQEHKGFLIYFVKKDKHSENLNEVLKLREPNEKLLEMICNDLNLNEYESLSEFIKKKSQFYMKKINNKKEIGDFGELFFIYNQPDLKIKINFLESMSKENQNVDINNDSSTEIKTSTQINETFTIRYPQWKKVKKFVFVELSKNTDGSNILELIDLIQKDIDSNSEFLNQLKQRYKERKSLMKINLKKSSFIEVEKSKLNLMNEFPPHVESAFVKINAKNFRNTTNNGE